MKGPETSEQTFAYKHMHIMHIITRLRLAIHCGVAVTELSTNKQHILLLTYLLTCSQSWLQDSGFGL
jgi:hypothetical protein